MRISESNDPLNRLVVDRRNIQNLYRNSKEKYNNIQKKSKIIKISNDSISRIGDLSPKNGTDLIEETSRYLDSCEKKINGISNIDEIIEKLSSDQKKIKEELDGAKMKNMISYGIIAISVLFFFLS